MSKTPALSVVVVAFNGVSCLEQCLASLAAQTLSVLPGGSVEVLVVGNLPTAGPDAAAYKALQQRFPFACWLGSTETTNVPRLRGLGMAQAGAPIISLLEDDCVADGPDWCERLLDAHNNAPPDAAAIGGAVEPGGYRRVWDWAIFFAEYGARFLRPLPENRVAAVLPGTNVSYKAKALEGLFDGDSGYREALVREGFYEAFVHGSLRETGHRLKADSALVVRNVNSWPIAASLAARFHHGRGYAGMRLEGQPWHRRLPYMAGTVALPFLQIVRILRDLRQRNRYLSQFACALPCLLLCGAFWSAGEFVGYACGAGNSLSRWR